MRELVPRSVTSARTRSSSRRAVTDGSSSSATTMAPSGMPEPPGRCRSIRATRRGDPRRGRRPRVRGGSVVLRERPQPRVYPSMISESAASTFTRFSWTVRRTLSRNPRSSSASSLGTEDVGLTRPIRSLTSFWSATSSEAALASAASKRERSLSTSAGRMLRRGAADRYPQATTTGRSPRRLPSRRPDP